MDENIPLLPPEKGLSDIGYDAANALVGLLPGGSLISFALGEVVGPPIGKRMHAWSVSVQKRLEELERNEKDYKWRAAINNEMVISVFMHALSSVTRTHQEEKLEALRNVVLNSTLHHAATEDEAFSFLDSVDSMTVSHLHALKYMLEVTHTAAPPKVFKNAIGELESRFPILKVTQGFAMRIILDLAGWGFLRTIVQSFMGGEDPTQGNVANTYQTTEMAERFIKFIELPSKCFNPDAGSPSGTM